MNIGKEYGSFFFLLSSPGAPTRRSLNSAVSRFLPTENISSHRITTLMRPLSTELSWIQAKRAGSPRRPEGLRAFHRSLRMASGSHTLMFRPASILA